MRLGSSSQSKDVAAVRDAIEPVIFPFREAKTRIMWLNKPYDISMSQIGLKNPVTLFRVIDTLKGEQLKLKRGTIGGEQVKTSGIWDTASSFKMWSVLTLGKTLAEPTIEFAFEIDDTMAEQLPDKDEGLGIAAVGILKYIQGNHTEEQQAIRELLHREQEAKANA